MKKPEHDATEADEKREATEPWQPEKPAVDYSITEEENVRRNSLRAFYRGAMQAASTRARSEGLWLGLFLGVVVIPVAIELLVWALDDESPTTPAERGSWVPPP